jgi:Ca2+-binding EF-hand superfamily protein
MSGNKPDLSDIFRKIDTDNDNFISRADLQNSPYAGELFAES